MGKRGGILKKHFVREYWDSRFKKPVWFDVRLNTGKQFYKTKEKYKIIVNGGEYGVAELVAKYDALLYLVSNRVCREGFDDFDIGLVFRVLEKIYKSKKEWRGLRTRVSVLVFRWVEKYEKPVFFGEKK